ncbi:MAG TPA: HAMP domain-containing sensor histidine kinase [Streptosporangiaceae bacterium]
MRPRRPRLAKLRLAKPRLPKLSTRVLAGVLAVTLVALAGFDIAAVAALRGYLLGRTDSQLGSVLAMYRPLSARPSPLAAALRRKAALGQVKATQHQDRVVPPAGPRTQIAGPRAILVAPILDQYYVAFASGHDPRRLGGLVVGNPDLRPRLPTSLTALAASGSARTVMSRNGQAQLRLRAANEAGGTVIATTSLAGVNRTTGQLELILIIGSAVAALIAGAGVALIARRGLRPIETMAAQADAITAGDLAGRVIPHDTRTEVGRLGTALNGMLARIDATIHEREASQAATRRFFADASHELRTPLASLRANAELYQQGALTERGQVDEAMRRIALEAQRMSDLVDGMLRLARLDQHPERADEPVDLSALVTECAGRAAAADPARSWHTSITPDLMTSGDSELLRRAIDNLLSNVRAHTPEGTTAVVTAARQGTAISVEVSDDGPGVAADKLPRIFERFYRAAPSLRPGSGLGLAIASAVAAAHHGTASAAADQPCGLRVALTLPAHPRPGTDPDLGAVPPAPRAG